MADNSPNPKDLQQIEQYLRASGLSAQDLVNRMNAIKNSTADFNRELENAKRYFDDLNSEINDLSRTFKNVLNDLRKWDDTSNRINRSYAKLGNLSDKLKYDAKDLSRLSLQNIKDLDKKSRIELDNLKFLKENLDLKFKSNSLTEKEKDQYNELKGIFTKSGKLRQDENNYAQILLKLIQKRKEEEIKIIQTLGISGKLVDGIVNSLGKLGISSEFFENLKEDMRETAKSGSQFQVFMTAAKGIISGIGDALTDPVAKLAILEKIFSFFLRTAITANKESVNLSKNLGYGAENADRVRANFVDIESSSNNLNVTTANLSEAFNQLSESTGFVSEYSADALETQIKLTKQLGLTGDEAAGVYKFSVLTGQSSEATYQSMLRGYVATRNSLNVGIPFRAAIAEASKVSGQLAANMGYNAENTIRGVVATRALGTSLEQAKSQGESLLDFQTSIENELKAELITGQQLNLERARAAALMGDQVTVAEELAAQGMTAAKFSGMNVIAQKSFAEALGTTSDELANQLAKREQALAQGKSLAQITAEEADEAAKRQDVQEKFNAAMLKLQSVIGNLLAGPLGEFLETLSSALEIVNHFATPLKFVLGAYLAINAAKKIGLGYDIAMKAANQITTNLGLAQIGTNRAKNLLEKESLLTRIAGNVQLFAQLASEHGIAKALQIQFGFQQANTVLKERGLLLTMRDFIAQKATAALNAVIKTGLVVINGLKTIGLAISRRETLALIGQATISAFKGTLEFLGKALGPLAIPAAAVAAGIAGSIAFGYMKDGVVDPNKGPVMTGDFGSVQLDKNDKAMYGADGKIKVGTNLLGNNGKITSVKSAPTMDITPMISAINQVTAAVNTLSNKSWDVKLDSKSVGAGLIQNSYRSA